jgi:poly(A) polymerase
MSIMAGDNLGSFRRFLGVTPPIATTESNEREKEVTQTLMDELRRQNTFEGAEEARMR